MNNATPDPDSDWQEQMDAEWRKEAANRAALLESLIHKKDWVACRRWVNQWQAEASAEVLTRPGADLLPPTDKTNRLGDLTIMTHPIGYYTSYSPDRDAGTLLDQLQQRYGAQLQGMHRLSKMAFRAALANYITQQGGKVAKLSPAATETLKLLSCIGCRKIFPHSRWEASFSDCLWRFTMAFTVFLSKCNSLAMER